MRRLHRVWQTKSLYSRLDMEGAAVVASGIQFRRHSYSTYQLQTLKRTLHLTHQTPHPTAVMATSNPLLLSTKADTSQTIQLHPLVLLTISDYVTRHTLRRPEALPPATPSSSSWTRTPMVGAIIGAQDGHTSTLEFAFECRLDISPSTQEVTVNMPWFEERIQEYRDVHKEPALDLVAMFALGPEAGPQGVHLPVVRQMLRWAGSESMMLLLFHAGMVEDARGGKLPISLYESVVGEGGKDLQGFRELAFEVETGDAEMIAVDFVARGGGNAAAVLKAEKKEGEWANTVGLGEASSAATNGKKAPLAKGKGKGKEREEADAAAAAAQTALYLTPDDDELIASLTAKANAIKMLSQRLDFLRSYLAQLPPSYLTTTSPTPPPTTSQQPLNHPLLRNISSLLSRVPLLSPPSITSTSPPTSTSTSSTTESSGQKERTDVHLTSLLSALTRATAEAKTMGAKLHVLQKERTGNSRGVGMGMGMSGMAGPMGPGLGVFPPRKGGGGEEGGWGRA